MIINISFFNCFLCLKLSLISDLICSHISSLIFQISSDFISFPNVSTLLKSISLEIFQFSLLEIFILS